MEKSTPIGLGLGLGLVYGPIFVIGVGVATFFDYLSILLVVGGTFAALLVHFPATDVRRTGGALIRFFAFRPPDPAQYVAQFTELARLARREGLLALDRRPGEIDDELVRFGIELAVDGMDPKEIAVCMEQRIGQEIKQHRLLAKMLTAAGTYAPSFGMIGTLVGLIQMMTNLTDPSAIGAGMAVAMVTTFYGAILANLFCLPMAGKVGERIKLVEARGEIIRLGIIAIVRGDNPSIVHRRLALYAGIAPGAASERDQPMAQAA